MTFEMIEKRLKTRGTMNVSALCGPEELQAGSEVELQEGAERTLWKSQPAILMKQ